jgi:hypothetical protein
MDKFFYRFLLNPASFASAWTAWREITIDSFAYCRTISPRAQIFGDAERYALICARARNRKIKIEREFARLLNLEPRDSLPPPAHAYLADWSAALGRMLNELQFGREAEADAVMVRALSTLAWRWERVNAELSNGNG